MREIGMQFAPEVLDELTCGPFDIRHQRVTRILHTGLRLYSGEREQAVM
jgi:hypothetical protein